MTTFMTFAMTAVRISSDIPTQSDYLPLISLYMFLSIFYALISMSWFVSLNHFTSKKYLPKIILKVTWIVRKCLFWIFVEEKKNETVKVKAVDKNKVGSIKNDEAKATTEAENSNEVLFKPVEKCNRCGDCTKESEKEKQKKKEQKDLDENLSAFNYLAFFTVFSIMLICNLTIWLSML